MSNLRYHGSKNTTIRKKVIEKQLKYLQQRLILTIYTNSSLSISDLTVLKQYLFKNLRYHGNQNVPYIKTTFENIVSLISKMDMSNTFKS